MMDFEESVENKCFNSWKKSKKSSEKSTLDCFSSQKTLTFRCKWTH